MVSIRFRCHNNNNNNDNEGFGQQLRFLVYEELIRIWLLVSYEFENEESSKRRSKLLSQIFSQ